MFDFTNKIREIPDLFNNCGFKASDFGGFMQQFQKITKRNAVNRSRGERGLEPKDMESYEEHGL